MNQPLPPPPNTAGTAVLRNHYAEAVEAQRWAGLARREADRLARIAEQAETVYINALMEFNGQSTLPLD